MIGTGTLVQDLQEGIPYFFDAAPGKGTGQSCLVQQSQEVCVIRIRMLRIQRCAGAGVFLPYLAKLHGGDAQQGDQTQA